MTSNEFNKKSIPNIIAAWAGLFTGPNAMIASTTSFFILPWIRTFGFNRSEVSLVISLSPIIIAFCVPVAGRAMDRFGLRRVLIPGVLLFGLLNFAMSAAHATWALLLTYVVMSACGATTATVGYAKLISLWFSKHRGKVLGCCVALGASAGAATMPHVVNDLITAYNWRVAYMGQGAIILLVGFPLIALFLREPPRRQNDANTATTPTIGLTRAEALKTPAFWLLFIAIFLGSGSLLGTTSQAAPLLLEHGFPSAIAASAVSLVFLGNVAGQFSLGYVADRFNSPRIAIPYFVISWTGLMIFHSATNGTLLLASALILGLGLGAETAMAAYFSSRYFGLRDFSSIYGLFFAASNLGIFCGINAMGLAHDHWGSYTPMRLILGITMGTAALLMSRLPKYRFARREE